MRADGWLAEQLALQASGLTGALEEQWADVGPESAWLGGPGEAWERGPYYLDGLVPLAHLTGDPGLLAKATRWIDSILASCGEDGQIGPRVNDDWWPRMVALKALTQHHDATGDPRVLEVMSRYCWFHLAHAADRPLRDWGRVRGADELLSIAWLYERTGEQYLLELWDLLASQTADWGSWLQAPAIGVTTAWDHMTHVVNVAMGLKTPALLSLRGDQAEQLRLTDTGWDNLMREHGQVHGMFSGDEWLAGTDARRGVELCAVVEAMFSFEQMVRIFGTARHGDLLERLAYNLLPATMSADLTTHQYHQQANQVLATVEQRDWTQAGDDCTIFGLEPQLWLLHRESASGLAEARALHVDGFSRRRTCGRRLRAVERRDGRIDGVRVHIDEATGYPFSEALTFTITTAGPVAFPLRLRLPGWCLTPEVHVGGVEVVPPAQDGFLQLDRTWSDGDTVELRLPMSVSAVRRPSGGIGLSLGPIVLAYSPGEIWARLPDSPGFGDWEVRPRRSWNAALVIDPDHVAEVAMIERLPVGSPPFGLRTTSPPFGFEGVPLKVWVPGRRVADWRLYDGSAAPVPRGPFPSHDFDWPFPLVPYGSARLRIAEFPVAAPSDLGSRAVDEPPA